MINKYALTSFVSQLSASMPASRILMDEPMSEHTTFAVGGPADVLVLPKSVKEMSLAIRAARSLELPVTVLGGGSNVLVRDGGIRGVVIQLNQMMKVLSCNGVCTGTRADGHRVCLRHTGNAGRRRVYECRRVRRRNEPCRITRAHRKQYRRRAYV